MDSTINGNGPVMDFDKVIALFTGPNSADLHERHVAAINRLCRNNSNGFAIRDLPKVQQVLELSVALLQRGSAIFLEPLCELVSLLAKPFIRRTATDEFKMLNHITNILAAVGAILRSTALPKQLYIAAAQTLAIFANAYGNRPNVLEMAPQQSEPEGTQRQYHTNQSLVNKSGVISDVITALARALRAEANAAAAAANGPDGGKLVPPLTGALLAMSYTEDNCTSMVESGVLQCITALLARGARAETTCIAVELAWNVVEHAPLARSMLSQPLPSLRTLARGRDGNGSSVSGATASASGEAGPGPGSGTAGVGPRGLGRKSPAYMGPNECDNGSGVGGVEGRRDGGSGPSLLSGASEGFGSYDGSGAVPRSGPAYEGDDDWPLPDGGGGGRAFEHNSPLRPGGSGTHGDDLEPYIEFAGGSSGALRYESSRGGVVSNTCSANTTINGGAAAGPPPGYLDEDNDPSGGGPFTASDADAPVVQPLADALTGLLRALLISGFSKADKELRNDILVVLNLLLEAPDFRAAAAYVRTFDSLLAAATAPELTTRTDLVAQYALTTDALDHELRLLVWSALQHGCLLPEVLESALAGGLLRVLLLYVSAGDSHPVIRRWNSDQLSTLRAAALSKLHVLSPMCPEEYERAGGPATLMGFVAGAPGAGHLEAALRHLHRLFVLVPESRDVFGVAGLIPILLGLVGEGNGNTNGGGLAGNGTATTTIGQKQTNGRVSTITTTTITPGSKVIAAATTAMGNTTAGDAPGQQPEAVRHFALLCLTALCTVHAENQRRLRKAGGVGVLLGALGRLRALDPLLPAPYAVAVLDCIWAAVVPDRKSTARFLVDQGMDLLLAHLESGNKGHRPVALRLLSDLLENPRSHPFFHDWQSDVNKQTAAHLLLHIWTEEDGLRGMTGPDGLLANTARPLAGMQKRAKWLPPENVAYGNMSPAKKETVTLMMNSLEGEVLLAKIYGIFKLVGFDACAYMDQRDHAVLAAVEKYAKFRQGDVWRSIQTDFDAEGLRPTAPDRLRVESGIELSESLAVAVREAQARLLGRAQSELHAAETKLFDGMRSQAKLEAEHRFIQLQEHTPLTLSDIRRAKEQKAQMLRNSLQSFEFQAMED